MNLEKTAALVKAASIESADKSSEADEILISNKKQPSLHEEICPQNLHLTKFLASNKSHFVSSQTFNRHHELDSNSVLNLSSRRTCSSSSNENCNDNDVDNYASNGFFSDYANHSGSCHGNQSDRSSTVDDDHELEHTSNTSALSSASVEHNNSLPLKLRHKSHFIGDKESAATALLSLHNIKQEPCGASTSPIWDGENSSDERDSGISIGHREGITADWSRKIIVNSSSPENFQQFRANITELIVGDTRVTADRREIQLKSHLARLESEIHNIKNMMILSTTSANNSPINV